MLLEQVVIALLVLQVDVVEVAVEQPVRLDVLRVGLDLVEARLPSLVLPLQRLEGLGAAADLVLVGLSVAVDEQLLGVGLVLGVVELELAVLPTGLEAPAVLED